MIKVGRDERCPCGSGKKYKRCCLVPLVETNPDVDDFLIMGVGVRHFLEKGNFEEIVASVREFAESHDRTLKVGPTRTHVDHANIRYASSELGIICPHGNTTDYVYLALNGKDDPWGPWEAEDYSATEAWFENCICPSLL